MSSHSDNFTWSRPDNGQDGLQGRQYYYNVSGNDQFDTYNSFHQDQIPRTVPQVTGAWMTSDTALGAQVRSLGGDRIDPAMSGPSHCDYPDESSGHNDDVDNTHWQYATECIDNMELPVAYQRESGDPPESPQSRAYNRVYDVLNADYSGTSSSSASVSGQRPSRHRASRNQHNKKHKTQKNRGKENHKDPPDAT